MFRLIYFCASWDTNRDNGCKWDAIECKDVLLLFLIQTIPIFLVEEDVDSMFSCSSYFTIRENKRFKGYVVKRFDSPSLLSCDQQCMSNAWYTSTNYEMSSNKDDKGTCEVNKKHNISLINEHNTFLHCEMGATLALLLSALFRIAPVSSHSTF